MKKKILKEKCSLEDEYAFEHRQRIKAENYISEIWEMNQELTNEVIRLQKELSGITIAEEEKQPLTDEIKLQNRIKQIMDDRNRCYSQFDTIIKKALK